MVENILEGIEVRLNTDYLENKEELDALADKIVYTGPIDRSIAGWNILTCLFIIYDFNYVK